MIERLGLSLESLRIEHAEKLYRFVRKSELYDYIPRLPPVSLDALTERYTQLVKGQSPDSTETWLNWAVAQSGEPKTYIGKVEATILKNGLAYIAYEFDPDIWSQGYAHKACLLMLDSLYTDRHVLRTRAHVDTRNQRSIKLLERLGFVRIETLENADFFKGARSDEHIYELR